MINRRKLGFIDLENLMHFATDKLVKSVQSFTFLLGKLERYEDRIIIRCLGKKMKVIKSY